MRLTARELEMLLAAHLWGVFAEEGTGLSRLAASLWKRDLLIVINTHGSVCEYRLTPLGRKVMRAAVRAAVEELFSERVVRLQRGSGASTPVGSRRRAARRAK